MALSSREVHPQALAEDEKGGLKWKVKPVRVWGRRRDTAIPSWTRSNRLVTSLSLSKGEGPGIASSDGVLVSLENPFCFTRASGCVGHGSRENCPGGEPRGSRGSFMELTEALGRGLSQDRGAVGDQSLCYLGVPVSS